MFDKIVLLSIILSLLWHSLAFVLFKLAQPYGLKDRSPVLFKVTLIPSSKNIQQRVNPDGNGHFTKPDTHSRLALPRRSDQLLPIVEESINLVKKRTGYEQEPIFITSLVKHNPVLKTDERKGSSINYDILPQSVVDTPMKTDEETVTPAPLIHTRVRYTISGLERNMVDATPLADNISIPSPVILRFSVDEHGKVRFIIIEKSSGLSRIDTQIVNTLKKWRFSKTAAIDNFHTPQQIEWGKIVFFLEKIN